MPYDPNFVPFDYSAFQARYRYQILGKDDYTYSNIAQSLPDDWRATVLKERRLNMARTHAAILFSGADANTKSRDKAVATIAFAKTTVKDLQLVLMTADPSKITSATTGLLDEVSSALNSFKNSDGASDARKDQFYADVRDILDRLKWMMVTEKGRLSSEGTYFRADLYNAQRSVLESINTVDLLI